MSKIEIKSEPPYAWVTINRPEVRNAFDGDTLSEFARAFRAFPAGEPVRVVFLAGAGGFFSAGADLKWMKGDGAGGEEAFRRSSDVLADALQAIAECPLPTVALVEKGAMGGAVGFVAACDFALAEEGARFRTSEVRLGLAPAVVGPYLLRRLGDRAVRDLFLRGEFLDAEGAKRLGLVQRVVPAGELFTACKAYVRPLLQGGPQALAAVKEMLRLLPALSPEGAREYTAALIAKLRAGPEGQEGMAAFLEKRKPGWVPKDD
ncbi:MAG: enoyl-CoA hydratase-related protein [Planctomycetota bacterium]